MSARAGGGCAQVWIWLRSDDPGAVSALAVTRSMPGEGRAPATVRRFRVMEVRGTLPPRAEVEALIERSSQFCNPQKEAHLLRLEPGDAVPLESGEGAVLVFERGGERRASAERWWAAETGRTVEVREGEVWALRFEPGVAVPEATAELAVLRDREHGLFCNPHAQEHRVAGAAVPLPWLPRRRAAAGRGSR